MATGKVNGQGTPLHKRLGPGTGYLFDRLKRLLHRPKAILLERLSVENARSALDVRLQRLHGLRLGRTPAVTAVPPGRATGVSVDPVVLGLWRWSVPCLIWL